MTEKLNNCDIDFLRICNGEEVPGACWGAWMTECGEHLKSIGLVSGHYEITDKGKEFLRNLDMEIFYQNKG